jgi:hypothetical protein
LFKNNAGEFELYADGVSVIHVTGLVLQTLEHEESTVTTKIKGLQFQTFFGGRV